MKKVLLWILVILIGLAGLAYAGQRLYWDWTHITVGGIEYPLEITELDLSHQPVSYVKELPQLQSLKHLDLRYTGITPEQLLWLRGRMPECEILWMIPFQGQYLPEDTKSVTVTSLTSEDVALLHLMPQLETVDGRLCPDPAPLLELKTRNPHLNVYYSVPLEGKAIAWDAVELSVAGEDFFKLSEAIDLLPRLKAVTITKPVADVDAITGLEEIWEHISFSYCLDLYGQAVELDVETLDFTGIPMENTQALEAAMPLLTRLKHVEMVDCGIPDEDMAALNERWPDTFFAWEIAIGKFKIRNDATHFMPYQYRHKLTDADADKLKYLTELICIDFGHMNISRSDYLAYMPKLQYLLICDTLITDISYCANMKDLKYAEFFLTPIKDFSPLLECPNLVDLNVSYCHPEDPLIFGQMPQLKNLWFRCTARSATIRYLNQALPNTRMVFTEGSSTGDGWRELPNYYAQRDILGMYYMEG